MRTRNGTRLGVSMLRTALLALGLVAAQRAQAATADTLGIALPVALARPPGAGLLLQRTLPDAGSTPLGAERARILLRSLTVPGWGQATIGRRTAAGVFALAEVGVWASFTAFRIQHQMRRDAYVRTARLLAGIDLEGRDEEFRRIVGSFLSSDEYNQLVVYRDAANLYYDDPMRYRQYIADNELKGEDVWNWQDVDGLLRYVGQRKDAQRAELRANTAFALAIVNRLLSAIHAARAGAAPAARTTSWSFEVVPVAGEDATAFAMGVRARF